MGFGTKKKIKKKNGEDVEITLLNPREKAEKFLNELKVGFHLTNDLSEVKEVNGSYELSNEAKAYRSGYLDARKDSAKAFIYRNPDYPPITEGGKKKAQKRAERIAKKNK